MDALAPEIDRADALVARSDTGRSAISPLTHLEQLEAESIHIIREAVAEV